MVTRYMVELDRGGELQVVRQNLEIVLAGGLEARGRRVRLQWRPDQTYTIEKTGGTKKEAR